MQVMTLTLPDRFEGMSPLDLGIFIEQAQIVAKLLKAAEAFALARVQSGGDVPGWTLGEGRRSREWKSEAVAIEHMSRQGINDPYERLLLSVAKAEKKVPHPEALEPAWEYVEGKPALKPASVSALAVAKMQTPYKYGF